MTNSKYIKHFIILFLISILIISLVACTFNSEELPPGWDKGRVVRVVDGDTIIANINGKEERVRFIGIDTPETVHPTKKVEFFGKEASDYTKKNLNNQIIYLEKDTSEIDRYGRLLRYIWLDLPTYPVPTDEELKTLFFNGILVKEGYAHASSYPPDTKYEALFEAYEKEANLNKRGLWKNNNTTQTPNSNLEDNNENDDTNKMIKGNKRSKIYHLPEDPHYNLISEKNIRYFKTEAEAEAAGYRRTKQANK